jgi:TP901 family phage tail tape measure protein
VAFLPGVGGTSIGQALIRISADTSRMKAEMAQMNAQVRGEMAATGQTVKAQSAMMGAAASAVKMGIIGMGVGFAVFAVDAIKATAAFDKAMAKVYALTGQTADQMAGLRKQVIDLSTVVPQSATKLAEGLYYVISAGFTAGDALKVLKVAAMDATAGLTDTQTVADGLTSAMNAYGYSADQAAHVSDIMTSAVTAGKMEWSELAGSIGAAAVQGATAGVSLEEVTSAIATMTRSGLSAARASMGTATLMRALGNPTAAARKEMAALGITYDANTLKQKGLIGTMQMLSAAAGKHTDVIVRLKNGNIDEQKSADATMAANKGYAANLQTMTGNARGFLAAQILLADGAKSYTAIYESSKHASDGIGLSADAFAKFAAADPGVQFQLLINKVQAAAIGFGTVLLPKLAEFLTVLTDLLPRGMKVLGDIWNNTLSPVFAQFLGAAGKLAVAIAGIFSGGGGKAVSGGSAIKTILQGIADVIATVVRTAAVVADALSGLFSNPIVAGLTKVLGIFLILKATVGGIMGIGASLAGSFKGLASTLSGGFLFKTSAVSSGADATLKAGATAAATEMKAGGAALSKAVTAAGAAFRAEILGTPVGAVNAGRGTLTGGVGTSLAGVPLAVGTSEAEKAAYLSASRSTMTRIRDAGTNAVTSLKNGLTSVGSKISGFLGGAANLIMPLMVAGIAASFLQGPVGEWVSGNAGFKRAGEKIKTDLIGGIIDLFTKSLQGADEAIGHADTMTIGTATFSTVRLAKLGIKSATFDQLEAPLGTIENFQGAKTVLDSLNTLDLSQGVKESALDYLKRVTNGLDDSVLAGAQQFLATVVRTDRPAGQEYAQTEVVDPAGLQAYLTAAINDQINSVTKGTWQAGQAALQAVLQTRGFTPGQVSRLTTDQMSVVANIAKADATGTLGWLQDALVKGYTGVVKPTKPAATGDSRSAIIGSSGGAPVDAKWLASIDQQATLIALQKNRTAAITAWLKDVPKETQDAITAVIERWQTNLDPKTITALNKQLNTTGDNWLLALKGADFTTTFNKKGVATTGVFKGMSKSVVTALIADFNKQFATTGDDWKTALAGAAATIWGKGGGADADILKAAIQKAIAGAVAGLTPKDLAPTPKKGKSVDTGTVVPTAKQVAATKAAITTKLLDPAVQGMLAAASGPDAVAAKKGVKDLGDALTKAIPDAGSRNRFIATLVDFGKVTDESKQITDALSTAVPTAGGLMIDLANAMNNNLTPAIKAALAAAGVTVLTGTPAPPVEAGRPITATNIPPPSRVSDYPQLPGSAATPAPGPAPKSSRSGPVPNAAGGFLSAKQPSWVGEGGGYRELFVPGLQGGVIPHTVSQFIAALVPKMGAAAAGAGGRSGAKQTIYVDRMELHNKSDERSVLEGLQFLAPLGR